MAETNQSLHSSVAGSFIWCVGTCEPACVRACVVCVDVRVTMCVPLCSVCVRACVHVFSMYQPINDICTCHTYAK